MGSPLFFVGANIFTKDFETTAITASSHQQRIWHRYVNDTFVIWEHG